MAQGVHRWSPPEAGAKDRVEAVALEVDEGNDPLVGGGTRQHSENRKQQQMAHAVALPLCAARIPHLGECGKQGAKRHQGALHEAGKSLPNSRHLALAPPTRPQTGSGPHASTAWPWPRTMCSFCAPCWASGSARACATSPTAASQPWSPPPPTATSPRCWGGGSRWR